MNSTLVIYLLGQYNSMSNTPKQSFTRMTTKDFSKKHPITELKIQLYVPLRMLKIIV